MKIRIMSREEAEDTTPDLSQALISITDPKSRPADIKRGWYSVLAIQFHDIDMTKQISPFLRADILNSFTIMTREQAQSVVGFVEMVRADGVTGIVCHCEAGISRSAAVAKWIADHYHLPPLGPAVRAHNRYVYQLLAQAAARKA